MVGVIILLIVLLWFFGYVSVPWLTIPRIPIFDFNGKSITLWEVLIFLVIASTIGMLPSPFRELAMIIVVLWILSTLGFLAIAGLPHLLLVTIVVGLAFYLISGRGN